jgi:hypothetical protein
MIRSRQQTTARDDRLLSDFSASFVLFPVWLSLYYSYNLLKTLILGLAKQIISPTVLISNQWRTNDQGIPLGFSLSPVLAELYLLKLDRAFDQNRDFYYQRFNDDTIVLTKTK